MESTGTGTSERVAALDWSAELKCECWLDVRGQSLGVEAKGVDIHNVRWEGGKKKKHG